MMTDNKFSKIKFQTANEKSGKHSGCWWPGAEYEYDGINCTFQRVYDPNVAPTEIIDTAMDWLTHESTPANLVMLYIHEPDKTSHKFGPNSFQVSLL